MSLIIPANSLAGGGFAIDNSCRFNVPSGDYLIRSISSSGSNQKFTASGWIKRTQFVASSAIYCSSDASSNHNFRSLFITADDKVQCAFINGTYTFQVETSALLRDPSAWYHIVTSVDTTQVTSSDRVKIWINGVLQTSFSTASYPTLNATNNFSGTDIKQLIASLRDGSTILNGGYLSEIYVLDGINKTAEDFGEFDADSGVWKPIVYEGTYGTNGFFLEFQDSGALGTDSSGNANTFTVNNLTSIDQTTDTPTNNFATWNPLYSSSGGSYNGSFGNTQVRGTDSTNTRVGCTLGISKGKYYWEVKQLGSVSWGGSWCGIIDIDTTNINGSTLFLGNSTGNMGIRANNNWFARGNAQGESASAIASPASVGDIVMFALDMDNNFLYAGLNGTWLNSGVPTSGATGTGNINNNTVGGTSYSFILTGKTIMPAINIQATDYFSANFGNPPFTIASGNADANGLGNFEYTVPTGYLSLCTKNLSEVNS